MANRGDGAGGYLFGGQGSATPPFVDGTGGVVFRGEGGQAQAEGGELLPMTFDGAATWLQARSGNGVFASEPAAGNGSGAWVDGERVADPSAVTGANYSVDFSVVGGVTTYSVLKDGAATALVDVPYVAGQDIAFDGIAMRVNGAPSPGRSIRDRAVHAGLVGVWRA